MHVTDIWTDRHCSIAQAMLRIVVGWLVGVSRHFQHKEAISCHVKSKRLLTLSLPLATIVDTVPVPLATKVDRTPSVPLAIIIAVFTNVRGWSLIS